ncbi:phosphoheptose isomerase, partial [Micromonospora sp. NPDC047707]
LLHAAHAAHDTGLRCWAFTGPTPNPLADLCDETLAVDSPDGQVVQELHLVSSHVLCEYVERALPAALAAPAGTRAEAPAGETDPPAGVPAAPAAGPVRAGVEVVLDGGPQVQAR